MYTLQLSVKDFLLHCKFEKNLSEKTLKAYETDLSQFQSFLKVKSQTEVESLSKNDLRDYIISISSLKPKSVKRKLATVKALFNFLEFEDKILINPFRKMKIKIKEAKTLPIVMNIKEITDIFKEVYSQRNKCSDSLAYSYMESVRNIAIVEFLFTTGARVSEIANLKDEDVNLDTGVIKIKGKGNKERIIQICNKEAISILRVYYKLFKNKIKREGHFLINRFNKKLSDQSIRLLVKNLSKSAGISKKVTPHIFRHSFATLLLEKDVDIKYIQVMLGHSSITTTQIYTHVNKEKQRQILESKHPRKDFSMSF